MVHLLLHAPSMKIIPSVCTCYEFNSNQIHSHIVWQTIHLPWLLMIVITVNYIPWKCSTFVIVAWQRGFAKPMFPDVCTLSNPSLLSYKLPSHWLDQCVRCTIYISSLANYYLFIMILKHACLFDCVVLPTVHGFMLHVYNTYTCTCTRAPEDWYRCALFYICRVS